MQIVTESMMKDFGAPAPSVSEVNPDCFKVPAAAAALQIFLTLTQSPDVFLKAGLSAETIFWSRYYWFLRFVAIQTQHQGFDAGLEQQTFQLLEHPFPPCDPDWSRLESVERAARLNEGTA